MNILWAPWRIGYITNSKKIKGCLFCNCAGSARKDKANLVVYRSAHCFSVLNKYPYNNGHLMICPYKHVKDLSGLNSLQILDLFSVLNKMQAALKEIMRPDGFNVGINLGSCAGAGMPDHMHIHLVPRWHADTNFMAVSANTKVISQSLNQCYEKLRSRL